MMLGGAGDPAHQHRSLPFEDSPDSSALHIKNPKEPHLVIFATIYL